MTWVPSDRMEAAELLAALVAWERICRSEGRPMGSGLRATMDDIRVVHAPRRSTTQHDEETSAFDGDHGTVDPADREFLSLAEVAKVFKVGLRTVQSWAQTGRLPVTRLGRAGYVRRSDLRELGQ